MKNPIEIITGTTSQEVITTNEVKISNKVKYAAIRAEIKSLSIQQRPLKRQRKDTHFTGIRVVPVWKATAQAFANKYRLRHLYRAYNIMKGVEPQEWKKHDIDAILMKNLLSKYKID